MYARSDGIANSQSGVAVCGVDGDIVRYIMMRAVGKGLALKKGGLRWSLWMGWHGMGAAELNLSL